MTGAAGFSGFLLLEGPRPLVEAAGSAAWLLALAGTALALPAAWLGARWSARFPGLTAVEAASAVLGPIAGRVVAAACCLLFAAIAALVLRAFGELLAVAFLPGASLWLALLPLVLLAAHLAQAGLGDVARMAELVIPPGAVAVVALALGSAPLVELDRLRPLFPPGALRGLPAVAIAGSFAAGLGAVQLVGPRVADPRRALAAHAAALLIPGLSLSLLTLTSLAAFGEFEAVRLSWPGFELARMVRFGPLIERAESLLLAVWMAGSFVQLALFTHLAGFAAARASGARDHRRFVWPLAVAAFLAARTPLRGIETMRLLPAVAIGGWVLPLLAQAAALAVAGRQRAAGPP